MNFSLQIQTIAVASAMFLFFTAGRSQAQPPPNDSYANPGLLTGTSVNVSVSNVEATQDKETTGGFAEIKQGNGKTVWWSWTAPMAGIVTIDTLQSSFDTLLAVYFGATLGSRVTVALNDDATDSTTRSQVSFAVTSNRVYRIGVDGSETTRQSGTVRLRVNLRFDPLVSTLNMPVGASVTNTVFEQRVKLSGRDVGAIGHNFLEQSFFPPKELWWRWTADTEDEVTIKTEGSSFDTVLKVFTGNDANSLIPIATNDNADPTTGTSLVRFKPIHNETYHIQVWGADSSRDHGTVVLHIKQSGVPPLPLEMTNIKPAAELTFNSVKGKRYQLQRSETVDGNWIDEGAPFVGAGGNEKRFASIGQKAGYFRFLPVQ